VRSGLA